MHKKVYEKVVQGKSDYNIAFDDLRNLLIDLGFQYRRQRGSHIMYWHEGAGIFVNLQKDGANAKAYEVRQVRDAIKKYGL